jgi:hypothetical protein
MFNCMEANAVTCQHVHIDFAEQLKIRAKCGTCTIPECELTTVYPITRNINLCFLHVLAYVPEAIDMID